MNWYNHYDRFKRWLQYAIGKVVDEMEHTPSLYSSASRPGYLAEVTLALLQIRDTRAYGRLSIRNGERFGLAHLYFKEACLVHVTGDKRDGEIVLNDLLTWSKGAVRFDPACLVNYKSLTWQQAQLFTRWLAFLEMRGVMQGIPRSRLEGFVRSLTEHLPAEPITFPQQIAFYEEHEEEVRTRQWQRLGDDVRHLVERTVPEEQRQQLQQLSQRVGEVSQDLAKRAARATLQGLQQAGEVASEAAKRGIVHADEMMRHTFEVDRRQQIIQSTQRTVESAKQSVAQTVDATLTRPISPGTPSKPVRSIRPASPAADRLPAG
jgi:hypothetical protein